MDDDGFDGHEDNCPRTSNALQDDQDSDGPGDACDPDVDGDGEDDGPDNSPRTPNRSQSDGDGVGDACDDRPYPPRWIHRRLGIASMFEGNLPGLGDIEEGFEHAGNDFPIDVCERATICRDRGYLPEGFEMSVDLEARFPFRAAVIDGRGDVVRVIDPEQLERDEDEETYSGRVSFEPDSGAYHETDSARGGVFQDDTYRLRVFGNPEFSFLEDQSLSVEERRSRAESDSG